MNGANPTHTLRFKSDAGVPSHPGIHGHAGIPLHSAHLDSPSPPRSAQHTRTDQGQHSQGAPRYFPNHFRHLSHSTAQEKTFIAGHQAQLQPFQPSEQSERKAPKTLEKQARKASG